MTLHNPDPKVRVNNSIQSLLEARKREQTTAEIRNAAEDKQREGEPFFKRIMEGTEGLSEKETVELARNAISNFIEAARAFDSIGDLGAAYFAIAKATQSYGRTGHMLSPRRSEFATDEDAALIDEMYELMTRIRDPKRLIEASRDPQRRRPIGGFQV